MAIIPVPPATVSRTGHRARPDGGVQAGGSDSTATAAEQASRLTPHATAAALRDDYACRHRPLDDSYDAQADRSVSLSA
jgi:hypothetical protein